MERGFIKTLKVDGNYCFVAVENGPEVYASRRALDDRLLWGESLKGHRVRLKYAQGDRGPYATIVLPAVD